MCNGKKHIYARNQIRLQMVFFIYIYDIPTNLNYLNKQIDIFVLFCFVLTSSLCLGQAMAAVNGIVSIEAACSIHNINKVANTMCPVPDPPRNL